MRRTLLKQIQNGLFQSRPQGLRYFCTAGGLVIAVAVQKDRRFWERDWASSAEIPRIHATTHLQYKNGDVMMFTSRRSTLRPYTS